MLCTEPLRHVSQLWARLGQSTVEEFATAALASGLSFVVFLEPYEALTNASLAALTAECKAHSTANLTLFAGFTIDTNIGDRTNTFHSGLRGAGQTRPNVVVNR